MKHYIGLDVSNKETYVCIVNQDAKVIKQFKVASDPSSISQAIKKTKFDIEMIGLESGGLSHWIVKGLLNDNLPVKCIDARRMSAIIQTNVNKTDKNDAKEIALAMRNNNYKEVHAKSKEAVTTNILLTSRSAIVEEITNLKNTVRGLLKLHGIKINSGSSTKKFVNQVEGQLSFEYFSPEKATEADFTAIRSLLICISKMNEELVKLDAELEKLAKENKTIQRLKAIPGVGVITALSFVASVDDPHRFKKSRAIGAYFGLTPKQYSSGESIKQGRISKCGPKDTRKLLVEAGVSILTVCKKWSKLKAFGMKIYRKTKCKMKAAVAIARKLSIIMHKIWVEEKEFIFGEPTSNQMSDMEKLEKLIRESRKKKSIKNEILKPSPS